MPIKYIGRTTNFEGKTLWEIVGNLKNFGVGRLVTRSMFDRYPEPTYFKILQVTPLASPANPSLDDVRKVKITVEKIFRGVKFPKPINLESVTYKADYKLIPRDEESDYCKSVELKPKVLPKYMEFPPLLKELLSIEAKKNKKASSEEPKLEVVYNRQQIEKYKIEENRDKYDVEVTMDLGTPAAPNLYNNIK